MVDTKKKLKNKEDIEASKEKTKTVGSGRKKTVSLVSSDRMSSHDKTRALQMDVFDIKGASVGKVELPAELFGVKVNRTLLAQAVRIYLTNQRQGTASTLTRGEVVGSTRKIYRQKGTGRARHGGVRAPIFVKGGIAHGPKPKEYELSFPKKMRRVALFSALTVKHHDGAIKIVEGLESIEMKTKTIATSLQALGAGKGTLIVMPKDLVNVYKAGRNLPGVHVMSADRLNTYEVLHTKQLLIMRDAIDVMKNTFLK